MDCKWSNSNWTREKLKKAVSELFWRFNVVYISAVNICFAPDCKINSGNSLAALSSSFFQIKGIKKTIFHHWYGELFWRSHYRAVSEQFRCSFSVNSWCVYIIGCFWVGSKSTFPVFRDDGRRNCQFRWFLVFSEQFRCSLRATSASAGISFARVDFLKSF